MSLVTRYVNTVNGQVISEAGYRRALYYDAIQPGQWRMQVDEMADVDWDSLTTLFAGANAPIATSSADFTPDGIAEALRSRAERFEGPPVELHNPECPKLLSEGRRACRCGTAPLEAVFEDGLRARKHNEGPR